MSEVSDENFNRMMALGKVEQEKAIAEAEVVRTEILAAAIRKGSLKEMSDTCMKLCTEFSELSHRLLNMHNDIGKLMEEKDGFKKE